MDMALHLVQEHQVTAEDILGDTPGPSRPLKHAPRDTFEIIQEVFDRPVHEALIRREGNELFYKNLAEHTLDFKQLAMSNQFKFKGECRIRRIKELVEIEYGKDFKQKGELGRVYVINHNGKSE